MKYNKSYLARRLALSLIIGGMFVSSLTLCRRAAQ